MPQPGQPVTPSRRDGTPINPAVDKDGGGDAALWGGIVAVGAGVALAAASMRGKIPFGKLGRIIEDVDSPNAAARLTPTPADQLKEGTIGTGPTSVKKVKDVAQTAADKTAPPRIVARDAMTADNDPDLQIKIDKLNREQHVASRLEVANAAKRSYVNGEVPLLGRRTIPTNEIRKMRDGLAPDEQDLVQKGVVFGTRMDDYKRVLSTLGDEINAGYIKLRNINGQVLRQKLLMDIRGKEQRLQALNDPNAPFEGNLSVRDANAVIAQAQANPRVRQVMDGMKKVRDDFNESRKIDGAVTQDYINSMQRDTPNFLPISKDPLAGASTWEKVKYGFHGRAEAEEIGKSTVGRVDTMYTGKRGPIEANPSAKDAPSAELHDVIDSLDEHIYEIHRQMRKSRAAQTFTEIMHGTTDWGNSVRVAHEPIPVKDFERMSKYDRKLSKIVADPRAYVYHADGNVHVMHAADPEVARAMRNNPSSTVAIADQMRRRSIGPERLFALLAMLFIAVQLALILRLHLPSSVLWSLVAMVGAGTVLSYATVAEYFPTELTGRANAVLNTFHFGWAFVLQYAIGSILQQWPSQDGHYPTIAYQVAFGFNIGLQVAALAWFELARLPAVRGLFRPSELLAIADRPTHTDDRP